LPQIRTHFRLAAIAIVALGLSSAAQAQNKTAPVAKPAAKPTPANEDGLLYQNASFGFRYQIPFSWVNRTQEMGNKQPPGQDAHNNDANKSKLLLAVFERPPEATGATINSAVVIAAESAASYPGLKKAEDYLGPLTELATANGFKADGEPYAIEVESRHLLRADFIKPLRANDPAGNDKANDDTAKSDTTSDKLIMHQCTLVLLTKGQIVSFTFIAGSAEELDDLMDGLHFTAAKSPTH
jgi:hypothetical protein